MQLSRCDLQVVPPMLLALLQACVTMLATGYLQVEWCLLKLHELFCRCLGQCCAIMLCVVQAPCWLGCCSSRSSLIKSSWRQAAEARAR